MNTLAMHLQRIPLGEQTRRWTRCPRCSGPLGRVAYGSGAVRGLYCSVGHAEDALRMPALRVVQPYLPEQHRVATVRERAEAQ